MGKIISPPSKSIKVYLNPKFFSRYNICVLISHEIEVGSHSEFFKDKSPRLITDFVGVTPHMFSSFH